MALDKNFKGNEAYVQRGSGWRIKRVTHIQLKIGTCIPYKGGCNACLPDHIKNKKVILNVLSHDKCALCGMYLQVYIPMFKDVIHQAFQSIGPILTKLTHQMLTYPVKLNEIPKFNMVTHLKINVMTIDDKFVLPLQLCK